jgi:hypothetical protein
LQTTAAPAFLQAQAAPVSASPWTSGEHDSPETESVQVLFGAVPVQTLQTPALIDYNCSRVIAEAVERSNEITETFMVDR